MPITINDCKRCGKPPSLERWVEYDLDIECGCVPFTSNGVRNSDLEKLIKEWNELNPMEVKNADNDK